MTIRSKLLSGFLILIIIFVISFFVNQRLSREVIKNSAYINNSESVIRNSNQLHKYMIDMQSGYRGYLLTGQENFLQPYNEAVKIIPSLIRVQRALISSKSQNRRLDSILILHEAWVQYADSLITIRQDTLPEATAKYNDLFEKKVKTEVGKKLNDEIRSKFAAFDGYEYRRRQERREVLRESIEDTRRMNLMLTVFSIGLALISFIYITRIITRRISRMVSLAEEISKGNFKTIEDDQKDELTKLSASLNTMSSILDKNFNDLTRKNKELDQFAYVVSHDLKAPLRGIDNITTWIEEDYDKELTDGVKKNLEMIKGRAKRLENMINGLLDYARIGRVKKATESVNVAALLRELIELLVPSHFLITIKGDMPVLITEKILIEQVFSNLISNAVKYNNKAVGVITITCTSTGKQYYEFTVADNGIGIQAEYFEKIFTIFQTLQERDAFESTGVGLAIVKKIIDDKGASITVRSEMDKETRFIFTWPKN